jgi:hypothetical protein
MKKSIYLILLLFGILSCTVKKRSYTKGFYVDWAKTQTKTQKAAEPVTVSKAPITLKQRHVSLTPFQNENEVQLKKTEYPDLSNFTNKKSGKKLKQTISLDETCGDLITFKDGDEVKAKVIEITDNQIKYKRCDNLDGPVISASKSSVFSIKYANGIKEVIHADTPSTTNKPSTTSSSSTAKPSSKNGNAGFMGILSLVFGILGILLFVFGILFSFPGLLIANMAQRQARMDPNSVSSGDLTLIQVARVLCIVAVILWLILAAFILLLIIAA